jgi:hypothetical protein
MSSPSAAPKTSEAPLWLFHGKSANPDGIELLNLANINTGALSKREGGDTMMSGAYRLRVGND